MDEIKIVASSAEMEEKTEKPTCSTDQEFIPPPEPLDLPPPTAKTEEKRQRVPPEIIIRKKPKTSHFAANVEPQHNSTLSTMTTKLSTDQLICKTPQDSPNQSVKSLKGAVKIDNNSSRAKRASERKNIPSVLYLGALQFAFGILMTALGISVVLYGSSLAQIGSGIWGGCLVMATGIAGVITGANRLCPLEQPAQKMAHTIYLALSLISLAISQLVVVISATGLARDVNNDNIETTSDKIAIILPSNYQGLLFNIALLVVACLECICAAIAAYKSSRDLCPCFRQANGKEGLYGDNLNLSKSHAIVTSWLGKQHHPHQAIMVMAPQPASLSSNGRKISNMTPIYAVSQIMPSQIIGYPLIPAPLGPVPSPIIPPTPSRRDLYKIHKKYRKCRSAPAATPRSQSRSSRKKSLTEEDVVRTYTGLDRAMAEDFIDICDSKNNSLCSDISCTSSSCQSSMSASKDDNACQSNSDTASHDYLVKK